MSQKMGKEITLQLVKAIAILRAYFILHCYLHYVKLNQGVKLVATRERKVDFLFPQGSFSISR